MRELTIVPLTAARVADLATLFDQGGDPKWCWCTYYRVRGRSWSNSTPADNRALLGELADRARAASLLGRPEPAPGELPVLLLGRAAGERHIAREEPARGAPLNHYHLEPVLAVTRDYGRGGLTDPVVHERHPRMHLHHRHPACNGHAARH